MPIINQRDKYHLYYLIMSNINEDKYDGLSHVAEHTLLVPADIGLEFVARGFTCIDHMCLYYSCEKLETLQDLDKRIMAGSVINVETVECAKSQVIKEIEDLQEATATNKKQLRFITEDRIQKGAIGDAAEITEIEVEDIQRWFNKCKEHGRIYRFIFQNAHEMIMGTPIHDYFATSTVLTPSYGSTHDSFLYSKPAVKNQRVQIYFRIPNVYSKEDAVKQAVYEFCVQQRIQDTLGIEGTIWDKFFDVHERYLLFTFQHDGVHGVEKAIQSIRLEISKLDESDFLNYRDQFKQIITKVMMESKSNLQVLNSIKRSILYGTPQILLEDLALIDTVTYGSFPKDLIINMPLKVILKE